MSYYDINVDPRSVIEALAPGNADLHLLSRMAAAAIDRNASTGMVRSLVRRIGIDYLNDSVLAKAADAWSPHFLSLLLDCGVPIDKFLRVPSNRHWRPSHTTNSCFA